MAVVDRVLSGIARAQLEKAKQARSKAFREMNRLLDGLSLEPEEMTPEQAAVVEEYERANKAFTQASEEWAQFCPHPPERLWGGRYDIDGDVFMWFACCDCGEVVRDGIRV